MISIHVDGLRQTSNWTSESSLSLERLVAPMTQDWASLGNSAAAERLLRPAALWGADCADLALAVFEGLERADSRPRNAIAGSREFGRGSRRDKKLRTLAWAAHSAANESSYQAAKYAARSAMLAAAIAYTHTDLNHGKQGIHQARHLLGPAVYAALAREMVTGEEADVADGVLRIAVNTAPQAIGALLHHFPPQPSGATRLSQLFHALDASMRLVFVDGD